jgi:hypothetical protein
MRKLISVAFLLSACIIARGQTPVGSWSDHLRYNSFINVAAGSKEVFASNGASLMVFNKESVQLRKLSRINGLAETGISTIAWSEEYNSLIIAYTSTNVDLVRDYSIFNIPDISRKYIAGRKEINRIRISGKYAYLACSFGIVVIDIVKKEIYDTWKPGSDSENSEVWDIAFGNGNVYAATDEGVFYADPGTSGLSYFGNWQKVSSLPEPVKKYSGVVFSGNKVYANYSGVTGDSLFAIGTGISLFSYSPGQFNRSLDPTPDGFIVSGGIIRYFDENGNLRKSISHYGFGYPDSYQTAVDNSDLYIADLSWGLVQVRNMSDSRALTLPGPVSNNAINISSVSGKTIICSGGVDASWNNLWNPLNLSVFEDNKWTLFSTDSLSDPMRSVIDPADKNHYFVSTWGKGLLEFRNDAVVNQFTEKNSPLQTIIPGEPFVRICGMAMDKDRNLWITQTEVPGSIKILKPDGTWIVNPVTIDAPTIGDIIITRTDKKWIVLPRGQGLFVMDDKKTPEYFDDDEYKKITVTTSDNEVISYVSCIAEDLDGNIWVGTDQGPVIYYNPDKIFDSDVKAFRIKIPRNDGSGLADFMLGTETITSIAVDGANRKWVGTLSSGSYLLTQDGTAQITSFNENNSPIFSNSVISVAVDDKTGDVWFATTSGVISYRGEAIKGLDRFTDVYAFPNPVREDFTGNVTITGLMKDTRIKITDISGNLVYSTTSDGGQATWDLTTYNGRRVATGVYLAFCASSDGSSSCVIKILVIN